MGNKQVKLGLRVDDRVYEAGGLVKGRVYLSVSGQQQFRTDSLHLTLLGEELAVVTHEESDHHSHSSRNNHSSHTRREVERASSSVIHTDVVLVNFAKGVIPPGQYEYPFEWELPANLPTTMHCPKGDSHCEIQYRLMAYLTETSGRASTFGNQPRHSAAQALCVTAQAQPLPSQTGVNMDPEEFRVSTCCFYQGSIWLGWDTDQTILSPGMAMNVGIQGMNQSRVNVQMLRARVEEKVSWTAHGHSEEVSRTLAEANIPASSMDWVSRDRVHRSSYDTIATHNQSRLVGRLSLPLDAKDSYQGQLMEVRHVLTVSAVTPGACCVTTPESSVLVRIQRKCNSATATVVPTAPSEAEYEAYEPTMVTADLLPDDWSPQEAPVVTLPVSSAVLLDSSFASPSAPDETLLKGAHSIATTLTQLETALSQSYNDPLDTLTDQLQNPLVVTTVQNLTPPEFVQVLKACRGRQLPQVARLLAGTMDGSFQCRHVVACLWGLPPESRMEVMRQIAPLATDLDTQREMVERELTPNERLHFQAALR